MTDFQFKFYLSLLTAFVPPSTARGIAMGEPIGQTDWEELRRKIQSHAHALLDELERDFEHDTPQ